MRILMSNEAHQDSEDSNTIYIHFVVHSKRNFKSFYKSYIKNNF